MRSSLKSDTIIKYSTQPMHIKKGSACLHFIPSVPNMIKPTVTTVKNQYLILRRLVIAAISADRRAGFVAFDTNVSSSAISSFSVLIICVIRKVT